MTNENTERDAPERIWAQPPTTFDESDVLTEYPCGDATEYVRADLSDAKDARIAELEAKLALAVDGLRECEDEIDQCVWNEYPHDHPVQERYRQRDFDANPARATLADLADTTATRG